LTANRPARPLPPIALIDDPDAAMPLGYFVAMCDDTGIFQHAVHGVPDRHHGYCVDDNARALLLCCKIGAGPDAALARTMAPRFASFIQHAWNPDNGRFRNFMGFDRRWLEPAGSEDSHGRTLWALGVCAGWHGDPLLAQWAAALFSAALPTVVPFTSPRAWAFALLGLAGYCPDHADHLEAARLRLVLAERLKQQFEHFQRPDWVWFEPRMSYDNARLCEALIVTGTALGRQDFVDAGTRALTWLLDQQTSPAGHFRPVGTQGFLSGAHQPPMAFDQQPVEAPATIAACLAAFCQDPALRWQTEAARAFAWFSGANDLGIALVDPGTGSCRDGLHPDRANENRGAESVLSYLIAMADIRQFPRTP
jgi:hypothetical protein